MERPEFQVVAEFFKCMVNLAAIYRVSLAKVRRQRRQRQGFE